MKEKKDLTKTPLIELIYSLTDIDKELGMILVQKDRLYKRTTELKKEYNDIIYELYRRFPPLENDVNIQPKTLRKRKTK